jgi:8-oxo-dGTP diphosphatase
MVSQQAVIRDDHGRVLILLRPGQDKWLLPGGRLEPGDTRESGFAREVLEETGLTVKIGTPLATEIAPWGESFGIVYECEVLSDLSIRLSDEHEKYLFVPPEQLPEYLWYQGIAQSLAKQLQ